MLITAAQVAERLGVSVRTVQRRAAAGELPVAMQVPGYRGALLFDPEQIADLAGAA